MSTFQVVMFVALMWLAHSNTRRILGWGEHWSITVVAIVAEWWLLTYIGHQIGLS